MKRNKKAAVWFLIVALALSLTACGGKSVKKNGADGLRASAQTAAASPDWVSAIPAAQDGTVRQLFVVAGLGMDKTTATVSMHERGANGAWQQVLSTPGYVGKYGMCADAAHAEGCAQTPIGVYSFNAAFGIAKDPGCAIPYVQVTEDTWRSGDMREGMHYNEMVSIRDYPDLDTENSEHITDYEYEYQYCLNISFNDEGSPGRGSAIFLHCIGTAKPYTGGCVALPEYIMKQVMQRVRPDCVVVIDTLEHLSGSQWIGGAPAADAVGGEAQTARKLIIDTDSGADDASALILAAKTGGIEILGVTTLAGNVDLEQSTRNALAALERAGSDAPVYAGAAKTLTGREIGAYSVFGSDGMGDADLIHPTGKAQTQDAVSFIINAVRADPGEVEIIALGPATNIALAMERDPDAMRQVKRIWSMGTAGYGHGNASPVADFNVFGDAEAYRVMLEFGVPVTVIGLDMCGGAAMWTSQQFETLRRTNAVGAFVADAFGNLRAFYAGNGSADAVMNCDGMAMMCALHPDHIKASVRTHASCITSDGETYAQVIFYQEGFTYDVAANDFDSYHVTLVTEAAKDSYFGDYLNAIR